MDENEIENLNIPISSKKLNLLSKAFPKRKLQVHMALLVNSIKHLERNNTNALHIEKIEEEGSLSNSVFKAPVTLIAKPNEHYKKKRTIKASIHHGHRFQNL